MQETWQIGGHILSASSMSIMHLSSGTVNVRTQLRLQVLYRSLFPGIATEMIEDLSYKLRCFGMRVEGTA